MLVNTLVGIILLILLSDLALHSKPLATPQNRRDHVRMADLENPGMDWLGTWAK
jgi:hypothetical protein